MELLKLFPILFIFQLTAAQNKQNALDNDNNTFKSTIVTITLDDGARMKARLCYPSSGVIKQVVIYVHGTGPGNYLDRRKIGDVELNYFDLFAKEFVGRGVAFVSYNKRGCDTSAIPPYYNKLDSVAYHKCLPGQETKDLGSLIRYLKKERRLAGCKVILLGWSEGTIIAAMAAEAFKNDITTLYLAGYANDNMLDIIDWQFSGESSMINTLKYFDADSNRLISRKEYESKERRPTYMRESIFGNADFAQLDINKDSLIDKEDFRLINESKYKMLLQAVEKNDDRWIWNNYFQVTSHWIKEHSALEANKSRLLRLELPILIFQGGDDANTPASGVRDIQQRFRLNNKANLKCFIFSGHNHDLNYQQWVLQEKNI
ncbi:alpha/beta fold hydrolase [Niabella defluvii]|nr:alpha/beta fold hydrolase [Niabella sp. I65]